MFNTLLFICIYASWLPISILYLNFQLLWVLCVKIGNATIRTQHKDDYVHLAKGATTMLQLKLKRKMIMGFVVVHVVLVHRPTSHHIQP